MFWTYFQVVAFWGSFLVFPFIFLCIWLITRKKKLAWKIFAGGLLVLALLFIYMRFVEPQLLVIRRETLNGAGTVPVRLAIISDMHLGVFKDKYFLARVLEQIKKENVDLVVIPGDFINDPDRNQLVDLFSPFDSFPVPVLGVTGNHDAGVPGHFTSSEIRTALQGKVTMLDNGYVELEKNGKKMRVTGISDLMEGNSDYRILQRATSDEFDLLLTHNPDSIYELPLSRFSAEGKIDLMVSGHTHGGQMFIPPLVYWMIPCKHLFLRGWYDVQGIPLYITSGLGEVVLPLRFLVPPEIVIMEIKI
jgi:predicted MPP superfamily phosphohydrolase